MPPIKPTEVKDLIPEFVYDAFNKLIQKNMRGKTSKVYQRDIVREIMSRNNISEQEIFSQNYLDVEDVYRSAGWVVSYDKPAYNESSEPYFEFTAP